MFHLLSTHDLSTHLIHNWIQRAAEFKAGTLSDCAVGKTGVFITDRPSLRTRASFTLAFEALGGTFHSFLPGEIGLGQRESTKDIAGVLGSYYDMIIARVYEPTDLVVLSQQSGVPVVNALSKTEHPAQALADIFTISEYFHNPATLHLVYVGDASNTAQSLLFLCDQLGWQFTLTGPEPYHFPTHCTTDLSVLTQADVVYTDTWVSMGQEPEAQARNAAFAPYYLTTQLFEQAKPTAVFMNDMPIRRGIEVDDAVVDGPRSIIYQQAENRIYMQMAIIEHLLTHQ
ncbi:MAG: ornithine carbamoyltransferase [Candidatus Kerfeldbacteria bacterium]|nr:ornithine carbamoyltransferase [Candidatus Kerfeldbacteria bacterium]